MKSLREEIEAAAHKWSLSRGFDKRGHISYGDLADDYQSAATHFAIRALEMAADTCESTCANIELDTNGTRGTARFLSAEISRKIRKLVDELRGD